MKKTTLFHGLIVLTLIICSGCASIVDGGRRKIQINSNPPGAAVTVSDGMFTISTNTPAVVRLNRSNGYFKGQKYTVKFELPGYYPSEMQINPQLNPWYFGNILFGGAIGIIVVDPLTGAMWTLSPRKIDWNLIPTSENLTPDQLQTAEEKANHVDKSGSVKTTKGNQK